MELKSMTMSDNMLRTREIDMKMDHSMDMLKYLETLTILLCEHQEEMRTKIMDPQGSKTDRRLSASGSPDAGSELNQVLVLQRKILAQQEASQKQAREMQQPKLDLTPS